MFDLTEEHRVFTEEGVEVYARLQRERERQPLKPGAAFEVTRRLLALNADQPMPMVKVILLSRNSPDLSLRAFNSFEHYGLSVQHGSFTSGRPVAPFVAAWGVDLFLSNADDDAQAAITAGTAAGRLGPTPGTANGEDDGTPADEVRIALDGDAVLFSEASDRIFRDHGLERFLAHERANAQVPMDRGPFGRTFLPKLAMRSPRACGLSSRATRFLRHSCGSGSLTILFEWFRPSMFRRPVKGNGDELASRCSG